MPLCCSLAVHFRMASELARHPRWGNQRLESRMRENRTYGSEGGEGRTLPDPYRNFSYLPLGPCVRGDDEFVSRQDFLTASRAGTSGFQSWR
jgi:hypothetical protein